MLGPTYPFRGATGHYGTQMVNALRERHEVLFVSVKRQYPDFLYPGNTQADKSEFHITTENEPLVSYINPLSWRKAGSRICEFEPAMVIFQWPYTALAPQLRYISGYIRRRMPGVLLVFLCHNIEQHEKRPFDDALTRMAFKRGDHFIVHDEGSRRSLLELKPDARIVVAEIPTFDIFTSREMPGEQARRELGLDPEARVILFFGHVRPYKGLKSLVKALPLAAEKVPSLYLLIVGEFWEDRKLYEEEISRDGMEGRVKIVDSYVPNEDVAKYFCATDLVVLPYESATASGILQIAYAFTKPVVTTLVGGLPDVVLDGETGYLVPPGDPSALAGSIVRFFEEDRGESFARNIESYRERFSWDRLVETVERIPEEHGRSASHIRGTLGKEDVSMVDTNRTPPELLKDVPAYYIQASNVDRRLLDCVDLRGKAILNVGCGNHLLSDIHFAVRGATVIGLDYNRKSIEKAKEKLEYAKEKHLIEDDSIEVEVGDGRELRFEDDSFDIVTSFSAIEHMPSRKDRLKAVEEMARVTKPGGVVVLTGPNILNLPTTLMSHKLFKKQNVFEHRYTPGELRRMMTSNGLRIEQFDAETVYTIDRTFIEHKLPFLKSVPLALFKPIAILLRLFNAIPAFKKLGMRIGYRAKKV